MANASLEKQVKEALYVNTPAVFLRSNSDPASLGS